MDTNNNNLDINPRWLSLAGAAVYASMCDKTLLKYIKAGDIYGTLKGGKWFVDRFSIDRFMLIDDAVIKDSVEKLKGELYDTKHATVAS